MVFDVITVADQARVSLAAALNIVVSQKTCPEARFCVALPEDSSFGNPVAEEAISLYATSVVRIPRPTLCVDGKPYRIENKINALRALGERRVLLLDSDIMFLRPLPFEFLNRSIPAAVPEHGKHIYPWGRLYSTLGLAQPRITVLLGSGEISLPWFNGGFVVAPNGEQLSAVWRMICEFVVRCDWVPERWPYLDQISLPLAFAQLSPSRSVGHDNVLPERFNQNVFYWAKDQSYVSSGFAAHHHSRVKLLEKYFQQIFMWVKAEHPIVEKILNELRAYDRDESA